MADDKTPPPPSLDEVAARLTAGVQSRESLDGLVEVLGLLLGRMQGMQGAELRHNVGKLKDDVQVLVSTVEEYERTEAAKVATANQVEQLVDTVVKTGSQLGKTIETQRDPIVDAFRGAQLEKAADGLKLLAQWMQHPTDEGRARVEELVHQLQSTMGTVVGFAGDEEARQKEEIRAGVKQSLDKIFKPKPFDPKAKK